MPNKVTAFSQEKGGYARYWLLVYISALADYLYGETVTHRRSWAMAQSQLNYRDIVMLRITSISAECLDHALICPAPNCIVFYGNL